MLAGWPPWSLCSQVVPFLAESLVHGRRSPQKPDQTWSDFRDCTIKVDRRVEGSGMKKGLFSGVSIRGGANLA